MPKVKSLTPLKVDLFPYTLERLRTLADRKGMDKLTYPQGKMADLIGVSPQTLARKGLTGDFITIEQAALAFAGEWP